MKNFLHKQREVLALLFYAAIVAGFVYLVILPILAGINSINDQIQQESMKQESVKLHVSQLPKIQKQYQAIQEDMDLGDVLLDKNKAVVLIEKLEKLAGATNNGITIAVQDDNASAKKTTTASVAVSSDGALVAGLPSSDYLQMKITLTGEYNSIVNFINVLEKFEYYADITAVQIGKDSVLAISKQPVVSAGMFSPSSSSAEKAAPASGALTATLDTVFYTK